MKFYLLLLSIILIAYNYSNSQTIDQDNNNKFSKIQTTKSIQSQSISDGIVIDSKLLSKTTKIEQDTSGIKNEITKIFTNDNLNFFVEIRLKEYNIPIKIQVFNMLGNLVEVVYQGVAIKDIENYPLFASNLPNGFYLCILQGPNFRDAEKFTISR